MLVEVIGGVFTAIVLGLWAFRFAVGQQIRVHDERVADLAEDTRRWFRDRDRELGIEQKQAIGELTAKGLVHSGAWLRALEIRKRRALHEYRDEMSAKRRRYRELRAAEGASHSLIRRTGSRCLARFELNDEQRSVLAKWRADVVADHMQGTTYPVDDPTSEDLEPDLRRFEREGDPSVED